VPHSSWLPAVCWLSDRGHVSAILCALLIGGTVVNGAWAAEVLLAAHRQSLAHSRVHTIPTAGDYLVPVCM
jgi:hypothetical protein